MVNSNRLKRHYNLNHVIIVSIVLILLSLLITVPAFLNSSFFMSWDGRLHSARFEQIFQAFNHGQLPPLVSFIGLSNHLSAMISMYPWPTSLFFILPKFIFSNAIFALSVGFFLVNAVTAISAYFLTKKLSSNLLYQILGITVYLFNGYHITILYARMAVGEILAYAFFPIILLGCLLIWENTNKHIGWLSLTLGMTGVANSHVLSLVGTISIIFIIEIVRLFLHKLTFAEIRKFIYAAMLTLLASCYALGNILYMTLHNNMLSPTTSLTAINPGKSLTYMLNNTILESATSWNLGIGVTVFLFLIFCATFSVRVNTSNAWNKWAIAAFLSVILIFSWWPWGLLSQTALNVFQFLGRFLSLSSILTTVAVVLYSDSTKLSKRNSLIVTILLIALSVSSISNYERISLTSADNPNHLKVTNTNYHKIVYSESTFDENDYLPRKKGESKKLALNISSGIKIHTISSTFNSVTYTVKSKRAKIANLPIAKYNGVNYSIILNTHAVRSLSEENIRLHVRKGPNHLIIRSQTPHFEYVLFTISILATLATLILISVLSKNTQKNI